MLPSRDRRRFLKGAAAAGAAVGLSDLSFLAGLPPVSADAKATGAEAAAEVLATVSRDRQAAVRRTLAYFANRGAPEPLLNAARQQMVLKGDDAHDYKFGAAVLEDFAAVSPAWRGRFLAACMMLLNGSGGSDSPLVARTRAALG